MPRMTVRLLFVLLLGAAGLLLWPRVGAHFERAFQHTAELTLGGLTFGSGGHAHFDLPPRARGPAADDQSWDAPVRISVDGAAAEHVILVNPRRLSYLPILLLSVIVLCSPLAGARKLVCTLLGATSLWAVALGSVWVTVAWVFNQVPGLVYDLSPLEASLLHLAYEGFVTPIANKYVIALVLAACLVRWGGARATLPDVTATTLHKPKAEQNQGKRPKVLRGERGHGRRH